ncbi:putative Ca2+/H+ antiporter (TMEM165/GDT1 family) [Kinneretia asaccharophila]|uniref:GDT1 family protein n=2 Tax=Roseateles asaccharophilus TaxID=582607 RepID=A0ABU2ADL5_9BURK|nr:putative Ca2+/H+ antiporter (TMEM165/GDT1 family) [Roseateles asaccharophilus]
MSAAPADNALAMQSFLIATGLVALAEIGDKTQLLAFMLAARFKRPWPIVLGIFVATIVNHAVAGAVGTWLTSVIGPMALRWILGLSFLAMAGWMLIPDKLDEDDTPKPGHGVFVTTVIAFFLAEMGDKTQIATVALAARFPADFIGVVMGTTAGMMVANVPAVLVGGKLADKLPVKLVHRVAAVIFAVLGVMTLAGVGQSLGL